MTAWIFHHRQERPDFNQRLSASIKTSELHECRVAFQLAPTE